MAPKIHPEAKKKIDAYIKKGPAYSQPIMKKLRTVILKADKSIVEDWKWGPNFHKNGMVVGFGAFKEHVALHFFKGSLMKDPKKILEQCGGDVSRRMYIRSMKDVNEKTIVSYVKEAVKLNDKDIKAPKKKIVADAPPELKKALAKNAKAKKNFEAMAPGYKREYCEHIAGAKRPETKEKRLKQAVEQLAKNLSLHHKYK